MAKFCVATATQNRKLKKRTKLSSKHVNFFDVPAAISNQIIRKYTRNSKTKNVYSVKLTVPGQGTDFDRSSNTVYISCLKLTLGLEESVVKNITKINQIELDETYAYVSYSLEIPKTVQSTNYMGIDRNATGCLAVCFFNETQVFLGKSIPYIIQKYKELRRKLQREGKFKLLKKIKDKQSRVVRDLNHKISKEIVRLAKEHGLIIKLEKLTGITNKKNKSNSKRVNHINHNWPFYQLETFIVYKAKLSGVSVEFVNPFNTSKKCSKCGALGNRNKKTFKCPLCGHADHADVNAARNIAKTPALGSKSPTTSLTTKPATAKVVSGSKQAIARISMINSDKQLASSENTVLEKPVRKNVSGKVSTKLTEGPSGPSYKQAKVHRKGTNDSPESESRMLERVFDDAATSAATLKLKNSHDE